MEASTYHRASRWNVILTMLSVAGLVALYYALR